MTAFDLYYAAIANEDLPAAIPITDGMATATFDVQQNPAALFGAGHDDWRARATTAIFACRAAHEGINAETLHSA